ncbi:MAG: metallopeptidase TldD-related protein [Bacillota bacterium]
MDCQRPSGDVSVKLTPLITHMLLDHYLFPMLTRKETKREQMGAQNTLRGQQQVIAPWLSIELDTLRPYHISSFRFDSRGIPGQRLFVTERGCLTARLGTEPGGSSPPTPLPNNSQSLVLHDLRRQTVDDGPRVLVTAIDGLQQHGTDGEFALGLRTAFLMNENRPIGRVRGLIRGNWWNLLRDPETKVGHEGGLNSLTVRCEFL